MKKLEILRGLVILQIQAQNKKHFAEIDDIYMPQIQALNIEIKELNG